MIPSQNSGDWTYGQTHARLELEPHPLVEETKGVPQNEKVRE